MLLRFSKCIGPNSFWCAVGFYKEANTFTTALFVRKMEGRDAGGDDKEWGVGSIGFQSIPVTQ